MLSLIIGISLIPSMLILAGAYIKYRRPGPFDHKILERTILERQFF
ncbi:MAG TPA: hypothetical protein VEC36_03635 [Patescibacteria group bacterium]|nr:hypothetical protein [Patescibacteria group bacterium]